jgi:hypothetical protein
MLSFQNNNHISLLSSFIFSAAFVPLPEQRGTSTVGGTEGAPSCTFRIPKLAWHNLENWMAHTKLQCGTVPFEPNLSRKTHNILFRSGCATGKSVLRSLVDWIEFVDVM